MKDNVLNQSIPVNQQRQGWNIHFILAKMLMKYLVGVFLLALLTLIAACSVPQLTNTNVMNQLVSNEFIFIKFFSPSCGHCIAMAPEYQLFYQQSQGKNYKVFEIDCTQYRQLCIQSGVKSYPTLQLIVSGTSFIYDGARTSTAMSAWVEDLIKSELPVPTTEEVKAKIGKQTFVIVSGMTQKVKRAISIARKINDYGINFYAFQAYGYIRLYKAGSEVPLTYKTDQYFPVSLIDWAFEEGRAPITLFSKQIKNYLQKQKTFEYVLGIIDNGEDSSHLKVLNEWCEASFKQILCLRATPQSPLYKEVKELSKAATEDKPTIFISNKILTIGYHFTQQQTTIQNLDQFFSDVKAGKLYRHIDAERDIRQRIKYTNVVKLTPETYKTAIAQNQYIFVEYYAPSCGHCVKFAPDYQSVATHFKNINSSVVIAALDLTGEEEGIMKQEDIRGYPHFRFFVRGNMVMYRSARSAESIIKFVTELRDAKFKKASAVEDITERPFIAVSGVEEDSYLQVLAGLFTLHPIYHISSQGSFSVSFHDKTVQHYEGKADAWAIYDWLEILICPILSSIGEPTPNKKMENALIKHIPLLIIVNKHQRDSIDNIIHFLNQYCEDKKTFVCGYMHKGDEDYKMLLEWFGDSDEETNRLFWINTEKSLKYSYEGNLNELTNDSVNEFIRAVQAGEVPAFGVKTQNESSDSVETSEQL